jgi:Vacuolar sorting 38 and autophagy-related subunit 14
MQEFLQRTAGAPPHSCPTGEILCSACVRSALQGAHERHDAAKMEWMAERRKCAEYFKHQQQGPSVIAELQDRSQTLREELERLRKTCAEAAVKTCAMQLKTEERQQQLQQQATVAVNRKLLHRLDRSICDANSGALVQAIQTARENVKTLRFQWTLRAFQMHRLQVEEGHSDAQKQTERRKGSRRNFVSGIGKIGGLPLPHAGPELFGVLPAEELQSALRLVAQLTHLTARCLGILLPHPILLQPPSGASSAFSRLDEGDIASLSLHQTRDGSGDPTKQDMSSASSISSALLAATAGQSGSILGEASMNMPVRLSMDSQKVHQRVRHAVSAVLAEDQSRNCSTYYALSAENMNQDEFAIALQLLQNNIIALCIRAGVPVAKLWPGEAVLLNLHAMHLYCETQVQLG